MDYKRQFLSAYIPADASLPVLFSSGKQFLRIVASNVAPTAVGVWIICPKFDKLIHIEHHQYPISW
jgi:hypothetical protein